MIFKDERLLREIPRVCLCVSKMVHIFSSARLIGLGFADLELALLRKNSLLKDRDMNVLSVTRFQPGSAGSRPG